MKARSKFPKLALMIPASDLWAKYTRLDGGEYAPSEKVFALGLTKGGDIIGVVTGAGGFDYAERQICQACELSYYHKPT